ncbi:MAG: NAD-dependent epimerase/dehydratase family protein [Actinobacteria bacterium]|nr:NAD-dependent epimerase/dehydratase family protein [Actinomycetota bacterium]
MTASPGAIEVPLVTGGGGFIGSNVVRLLHDDGLHVRVLDDLSSGNRENLDGLENVDVVTGDVRDSDLLTEVMDGVDVVFHLAASVGNARSIEHPVDDSEINAIGTLRVLEAMRGAGARKIVYSSSAGIFGELRHLPIREDHPLEPASPYGVSKLAGEKMCLAYAQLYDLEAVCLRYFNVYGVNQRYDAYGNVIPIFAHRLLSGMPLIVFSDGEQTRDFVNVRDVARANVGAARATGLSGAFNVASATSVTINHLVDLLGATAGIDPEVEYAPPRAGDVRDSLADISAARDAFAYEPEVSLEEGLAEYIEWMRVHMPAASAPR